MHQRTSDRKHLRCTQRPVGGKVDGGLQVEDECHLFGRRSYLRLQVVGLCTVPNKEVRTRVGVRWAVCIRDTCQQPGAGRRNSTFDNQGHLGRSRRIPVSTQHHVQNTDTHGNRDNTHTPQSRHKRKLQFRKPRRPTSHTAARARTPLKMRRTWLPTRAKMNERNKSKPKVDNLHHDTDEKLETSCTSRLWLRTVKRGVSNTFDTEKVPVDSDMSREERSAEPANAKPPSSTSLDPTYCRAQRGRSNVQLSWCDERTHHAQQSRSMHMRSHMTHLGSDRALEGQLWVHICHGTQTSTQVDPGNSGSDAEVRDEHAKQRILGRGRCNRSAHHELHQQRKVHSQS